MNKLLAIHHPPGGASKRPVGIEVRAVGAGEALPAFDDIGAAGEAARRQLRRHQPVIGRLARVQRLAHRAEHRLQPGRLGAGDPQRRREPFGIQPEQMRARRRGAEAADRGGGVEPQPIVMARRDGAADRGTAVHSPRRTRSAHPRRSIRVPRPAPASAGRIATDGCPGIARFTSSKSSACDAAPFTIAADAGRQPARHDQAPRRPRCRPAPAFPPAGWRPVRRTRRRCAQPT